MAAPRLLDKKTINAEVATQQKQKIIEGITLSKKVDKVRNTLSEEEMRLDKFRTESVVRIQQEIDVKIKERDSLESQNRTLREERVRLEAPVELKEEWAKIEQAKMLNTSWQEKLINDQVAILQKETDNKAFSSVLDRRDEKTREIERLAQRTYEEAQKKFSKADQILNQAEVEIRDRFEVVKERKKSVSIREVELVVWDSSLQKRELANTEHEIDLSNREKALKVRYETFIKAQNYIKNKKKS